MIALKREGRTMTPRYIRYTVADAQSLEPCVTGDWPTYDEALRERNHLALTYGEHFGLRVAGIDAQGDLHLLDTPSPSGRLRQRWTAPGRWNRWVLGVVLGSLALCGVLALMWDTPLPALIPTALLPAPSQACQDLSAAAVGMVKARDEGYPQAMAQFVVATGLALIPGDPERRRVVEDLYSRIMAQVYRDYTMTAAQAQVALLSACRRTGL
jgi:hypothetical protein